MREHALSGHLLGGAGSSELSGTHITLRAQVGSFDQGTASDDWTYMDIETFEAAFDFLLTPSWPMNNGNAHDGLCPRQAA
jgi:hypothetical protein